jgi:hypothetical protein
MIQNQPADSAEAIEKLGEIGALLAAALLRLQDRKSSPNSAGNRDKSLDFEAVSHGHVGREREDIGT